MPKDDPDATDPMTLTGVEMPASREDVEAMARGFAEEFAASGWDEEQLVNVFRNRFYAGPHLAWVQLGEARVRELCADAVRPWRNAHG